MNRTAAAPALAEPCNHRPARRSTTRALRLALAVTLAFAGVEVAGALVARSLALLADAGHMVTDAASLGLSLFGAWIAARPATARKTYGWYRVEILAAFVNGVFLIAVTGWIVMEAIGRLREPAAVRVEVMLPVAVAGLLANLVAVAVLHRSRGESLNVQGAYLHVLGDVLGSVGAIAAGAVIAVTGWTRADPVVSLALAALLLIAAGRLVVKSVDVLLEAAPAHVPVPELEIAIAGVPHVTGVHDLHVWTVSDGMVAMSAHAAVPELARHQEALEEITRRARAFGIQHVTVQLEREPVCERT